VVNTIIEKLPLASLAFLGYAVVGAVMLIIGTQDYGSFSHNILAFGLAVGALGVPRAISKIANGNPSFNLFGFIDTLPIPSIVFIIFLIASFVALATNTITFGMFSENILEVGIACGAVQAAKTVEHVFAGPATLPEPLTSEAGRPVVPTSPMPAAAEPPTSPPPAPEAPQPPPAAPAG
jgi:hypothetical protein